MDLTEIITRKKMNNEGIAILVKTKKEFNRIRNKLNDLQNLQNKFGGEYWEYYKNETVLTVTNESWGYFSVKAPIIKEYQVIDSRLVLT